MGLFNRVVSRLELMSQMFKRTGAAEGLRASGEIEAGIRAAMARCIACENEKACIDWLDAAPEGSKPPHFCANREMFEQTKKRA